MRRGLNQLAMNQNSTARLYEVSPLSASCHPGEAVVHTYISRRRPDLGDIVSSTCNFGDHYTDEFYVPRPSVLLRNVLKPACS